MKKLLSIVALMSLIVGMHAQITITQSDLPPFGTTYLGGEDLIQAQPVYDYFQTGPNFSWTPATPTDDQPWGYIVESPVGSQYELTFPTSNLMLRIPGYGMYYMEHTASYLITLGVVDSVSLLVPMVMKYQIPDTILVFPLTYLTSYNSSSFIDKKFYYGQLVGGYMVDSIRIKQITSTTSIANGWGTLVHPMGSFDVIREYKEKTTIDSTWARVQAFSMWVAASDSVYTDIEIAYHASGLGIPVYTVQAKADSTITNIQWLKVVPTELFFSSTDPLFSVFPNPAQDVVNLSTLNGDAEFVEIYDLNGKLMYASLLVGPQHSVIIQNWDSGIYMIRWITKGKTIASAKLIKNS